MIPNHHALMGFLRLKSWGFVSMLGLADMSAIWDLGPTDLLDFLHFNENLCNPH